jgi:predicted acyl esterase
VVVDRNVLVPLADGVTLAADLYRPKAGPVPVLISFYPYRKDDIIGSFTERQRLALVERGYAHLLVDVRGFGGSDGSSVESQNPRAEGRDAAEVVAWAAAQPWCDGAVGVWGVSYGGLVALAVAAERPPALRAIASIYGLQDVVANFVAPGDVRSGLGLFHREAVMLAQELAPPSFEDPEGRWRAVWERRLARLRATGPSGPHWLAHPRGADPYWRARTIELERIKVPAFIIGGWRDLFPSAAVEAFNRIATATDLLIGPWVHVPPDLGPEPVDWIDGLADFFDRHLRSGAARKRRAQVFVEGIGGGWSDAEAFPPHGTTTVRHRLGTLGETIDLNPTVGSAAGLFDPLGSGLGFPLDQAPDDARSQCWVGEPASEGLILAGRPELALDLTVESSRPAHLIAKLSDVAPDGGASLVSTGRLRVEHPGRHIVELDAIAYRLAPGHRWQLALSGSDFPRTWPSPSPGSIHINPSSATLSLPVASKGSLRASSPVRPQAEGVSWSLPAAAPVWTIEHEPAAITIRTAGGEQIATPSGARLRITSRALATVSENDPAGARIEAEAEIHLDLTTAGSIDVAATVLATTDQERYRGVVRHNGDVILDETWRRPS